MDAMLKLFYGTDIQSFTGAIKSEKSVEFLFVNSCSMSLTSLAIA
jgi:hypothetical protein